MEASNLLKPSPVQYPLHLQHKYDIAFYPTRNEEMEEPFRSKTVTRQNEMRAIPSRRAMRGREML